MTNWAVEFNQNLPWKNSGPDDMIYIKKVNVGTGSVG